MPKIVDKEQRRVELALKSKSLLLQRNIDNISISEITKSIGIGKGTFYEYFENKEELYFTLVEILIKEHNKTLQQMLESAADTRQKLIIFASFFFDPAFEELRKIYKTCKGLTLLHDESSLREFNTQHLNDYFGWFEMLLQEGIEKGELPPSVTKLSFSLFAMVNGIFILAESTNSIENLQEEIVLCIDTMLELVKDTNA